MAYQYTRQTFDSIVRDKAFFTIYDNTGIWGDGSHDDTAGWLKALRTLALGEKKFLWVDPGKFIISSTITIPYGGFIIQGAGWGDVPNGTQGSELFLANGANQYIMTMNNVTNGLTGIKIAGLKFSCNAANQTGASGGIDANGSYRNVYEDLYIDSPYTTGIRLHFGPGGSFGFQNVLRGCQFMNGSNSAAEGRGLWIDNCDENRFEHCFFQNNGGGNGNDNFDVRDENGLNGYIDCTHVNSKGGVKVYATGTPPAGSRFESCIYDGMGMGSSNACLALVGLGGNGVINCHFLNIGFAGGTSPPANTFDGIYTKGKSDRIIGCYFNPAGDGKNACNAMVELDGTNGQDYGMVIGNDFEVNVTGSTQIKTDGTPTHNTTSPNTLH